MNKSVTKIVKNHYFDWLATFITFDLVDLEVGNYSCWHQWIFYWIL